VKLDCNFFLTTKELIHQERWRWRATKMLLRLR